MYDRHNDTATFWQQKVKPIAHSAYTLSKYAKCRCTENFALSEVTPVQKIPSFWQAIKLLKLFDG